MNTYVTVLMPEKDKHFKTTDHGDQKAYYVVSFADSKRVTCTRDETLLKE